jgi:hypothetical protein
VRIFVLTATYELRVSRKSHLRDHPISNSDPYLVPRPDPVRLRIRLCHFNRIKNFIFFFSPFLFYYLFNVYYESSKHTGRYKKNIYRKLWIRISVKMYCFYQFLVANVPVQITSLPMWTRIQERQSNAPSTWYFSDQATADEQGICWGVQLPPGVQQRWRWSLLQCCR